MIVLVVILAVALIVVVNAGNKMAVDANKQVASWKELNRLQSITKDQYKETEYVEQVVEMEISDKVEIERILDNIDIEADKYERMGYFKRS